MKRLWDSLTGRYVDLSTTYVSPLFMGRCVSPFTKFSDPQQEEYPSSVWMDSGGRVLPHDFSHTGREVHSRQARWGYQRCRRMLWPTGITGSRPMQFPSCTSGMQTPKTG